MEKRYSKWLKNDIKKISALPFKTSHSELSRLRTPFAISGPGILQPRGKTVEKLLKNYKKRSRGSRWAYKGLGLAGSGAAQIPTQPGPPSLGHQAGRKCNEKLFKNGLEKNDGKTMEKHFGKNYVWKNYKNKRSHSFSQTLSQQA